LVKASLKLEQAVLPAAAPAALRTRSFAWYSPRQDLGHALGGLAAALFLLRESLVEMDVPTRQSYVMAVVRPEERTFASGVTHLVRLASWARR
jgi:hypothetical protein